MMGILPDVEKLLVFKWLVAASARAMKPGIKFDSVLIQRGAEGIGKTLLMQILAGEDRFYEVTAEPGSKDFRQLTQGNWILELGEIESTFRKSDIAALKMYITQTHDQFRVPYGSKSEKFPRHFLFCGSTNSQEVITDPDGVRRWWVVQPTKQYDLDWVRKHRDHIWAEVFGYFEAGEPLFLSGDQLEVFRAAAQQHRQTKGFYEELAGDVSQLSKAPFTSSDLLSNKFSIFPGSTNYKTKQMDLAHDLRLLGFVSRQCRVEGKKGYYWFYEPPTEEDAEKGLILPF